MSAPDRDREREIEAGLARLATRAVPDDAPVPAPPWQRERLATVTDIRRYGRATPWLVAAVLLVLAGLGVGAGVAFDAGAPDRGPVATQLPSPTATATTSDGTLGDPTAVATPSAPPSFDRGATGTAPDERATASATATAGALTAGIGRYGPVTVGMTRAQAQTALGLSASDGVVGYGTCTTGVPVPGTGTLGYPPQALIDDKAGGTVIGFITPTTATDQFGNGAGTTLATLQADYPGGQLIKSQGWTFTVLDGNTGLGFSLEVDPGAQPTAAARVADLLPGTSDYASGFEACVG